MPSDFLNQYLRRIGVSVTRPSTSIRSGMVSPTLCGERDTETKNSGSAGPHQGDYDRALRHPSQILSQRVAMVEAVKYPELDLSHLGAKKVK